MLIHNSGQYYPELDGLRCLAVTLVLIAHLPFIIDAQLWGFIKWAQEGLRVGQLGVDLFFVLSGFLITRNLLWERDQPPGPTIRTFFLKRCLRIFPIFYLTVLYCWIVLDVPTPEILANLFYVSNYYYVVVRDPGPLRHTWSLSVEEQFYLVWPFVVLLVPLARLNAVIVCGTIAIVALSAVLAHLLMSPDTVQKLIMRGVTFRILSLAAGALVALHFERILRWPVWPPALLALLVFPVLQAGIRLWDVTGAHMIRLPILTGWSVSIFLAALLCAQSRNIVGKVLQARMPVYIGRISYGIYLYHLVVLHQLDMRQGYREGGVPLWEVLAALGLTMVVAIASFHLIESPLLRLKDRISWSG